MKKLEQVEITLQNKEQQELTLYIDITDSSLSRKWLTSLNELLKDEYHLEKNYHWMGVNERSPEFIRAEINKSIQAVNNYNPIWTGTHKLSPYVIQDTFTAQNTITTGEIGADLPGGKLISDKTNWLHRWFEDLQGVSVKAGDFSMMSKYYLTADHETKWRIRQLNLLCHEYESAVLAKRKSMYLPEWQQCSQLFCFLNAPRFELDPETDYELFGVDTIKKSLGGMYIGVNKAVGKHHFEVFVDEARGDPTHKIDHLTTIAMRAQCQAAGDFDMNWSKTLSDEPFIVQELQGFRDWLINNNLDPEDSNLTIGHPKIGQTDLMKSFGTEDYAKIQKVLTEYSNVCIIKTGTQQLQLDYNWSDPDYMEQQLKVLAPGYDYVSRIAA